MKRSLFLFFILFTSLFLFSQYKNKITQYPVSKDIESIPLPPLGMRWVLNNELSDEFNAISLDTIKWNSYNPYWIGRTPGLFVKDNVSLKDGYLRLKGEYMKKDTIIFDYGKELKYYISTAAVTSKKRNVGFGYYECRFKANKTTLSTTFWMTSAKDFTYNLQPKSLPPGRFSQELDICECIGQGGDFKGDRFSLGMNSHVHYWYTSLRGIRENVIAKPVLLETDKDKMPSDTFNIYGCWWKDKESAIFYLNNKESEEIPFYNIKNNQPFYFPLKMNLIMSVETYPHPWIPLPTQEELSNDSLNTSYYDWVRSYFLLDAYKVDENNNEQYVFKNNVYIANKGDVKRKKNTLYLNIHYTASHNSSLDLIIYNMNNIKQYYKKVGLLSGFGNIELPIVFNMRNGKRYKIVCYMDPVDKTSNKIIGDSFIYRAK